MHAVRAGDARVSRSVVAVAQLLAQLSQPLVERVALVLGQIERRLHERDDASFDLPGLMPLHPCETQMCTLPVVESAVVLWDQLRAAARPARAPSLLLEQ